MTCIQGIRVFLSRNLCYHSRTCSQRFQRQKIEQSINKPFQCQHSIKTQLPWQQIRSFSNLRKSADSITETTNQLIIRRFMADEAAPPKGKPKFKSKGPITWKSVAITFAVGGTIMLYFQQVKRAKELSIAKERNKSMGKAAIGGDWKLVDHNGVTRTDKDFLGQWLAIYFGFTHCPDICPDEIEKMCQVVDMLEKSKDVPNLVPLFITVDPERDSKEAVKKYCAEFSPKLLGLTGTSQEIDVATRAYRVYYSAGPKDEDGDYIVDHTIVMYLINPKGEFVDYYGKDKTASQMAKSISGHMKVYAKS